MCASASASATSTGSPSSGASSPPTAAPRNAARGCTRSARCPACTCASARAARRRAPAPPSRSALRCTRPSRGRRSARRRTSSPTAAPTCTAWICRRCCWASSSGASSRRRASWREGAEWTLAGDLGRERRLLITQRRGDEITISEKPAPGIDAATLDMNAVVTPQGLALRSFVLNNRANAMRVTFSPDLNLTANAPRAEATYQLDPRRARKGLAGQRLGRAGARTSSTCGGSRSLPTGRSRARSVPRST